MEGNARVSIIIPVYNGERYIADCINSARQQTYGNLEIIVVNDGSADSSSIIAHELESHDCRIIVVDQENGGVNSARYNGIRRSSGEWICFLDSDDTLPQDAIERYLENTDGHTDVVVSGIDAQLSVEDYILNIQQLNVRPELWGKLFSREIIWNYFPLLERSIVMGEDFLINLVLALHAKSVRTIPQLLYNINLENPESVTKKFRRTQEYEEKYYSLFSEMFLSRCLNLGCYGLIMDNVFKSRVDGFKNIVLGGNTFDVNLSDWKEIKSHFSKDSSPLGPSEKLLLKMDRFQSLYRWIINAYLSLKQK